MEKLTVPFEEKQEAVKLGAVFCRRDIFAEERNSWVVPKELPEKRKAELEFSFGEERAAKLARMDENERIWTKILAERSTIKLAMAVKDLGVPKAEYQRVELLRIFCFPPAGELEISWDSMIKYSPEFNRYFGPEVVERIILDNHMGVNFKEELETLDLTEEQKILVQWVVPVSD